MKKFLRGRGFGLDAIELRVADDGIHLKPQYPISRGVLRAIESSGVKIASIAGYARISMIDTGERARNEELLKTLILVAEELRARVVRALAGRFPDSVESSINRVA